MPRTSTNRPSGVPKSWATTTRSSFEEEGAVGWALALGVEDAAQRTVMAAAAASASVRMAGPPGSETARECSSASQPVNLSGTDARVEEGFYAESFALTVGLRR